MILIDTTTSMHNSTLCTNKLGNVHFEQNYGKQNILIFLRDHNGVCLKNFQWLEQKL